MEQAIEAANISMSAGWGVMATSSGAECDVADISVNSQLKSEVPGKIWEARC